jgi:hypothetical protein
MVSERCIIVSEYTHQCLDWDNAGETFHEAVGFIWIAYCPWCGADLYNELDEEEIPDEPETT